MLSVSYKPYMLSVIMLNVIMLSVSMLNVVAPLLKSVSLGLHITMSATIKLIYFSIRHQCKKTTVLSCHRCLINASVEKLSYI